MGIVLDVILVLVLVAVVVMSAKKGILVTIVEVVAFALAIFLAAQTAQPVSEVMYKSLFSKTVEKGLYEVLPENPSGLSNADKAKYVIDKMPDFAKKQAEKNGITVSAISEQIAKGRFANNDSLYKELESNIVKPIAVAVLKHVMYFVLAIVYALVLKAILKAFCNGLKKSSLVGGADKLIGGVLGIAKGVVIVFLLSCLLAYLQPRFENEKLIEAVNDSSIVATCENFDPMEAISAAEVFISNNK